MDHLSSVFGSVENSDQPQRALLLTTARSYRTEAFIRAAKRLEVEVVTAVDMAEELAEYWNHPLGLDYQNTQSSIEKIRKFNLLKPLTAILALDDSGTLLAAEASKAIGLPHNTPQAAVAARDKHIMRRLLETSAVNTPKFVHHEITVGDGSAEYASTQLKELAGHSDYPCVLKPLSLSGSRGVIRVNNPDEFVSGGLRLLALLRNLDPSATSHAFLVEGYIQGIEVALEGLMDSGTLVTLAIFDKPDPLEGPYFEETIYVTPSRLRRDIQESIHVAVSTAASAIGLLQGPVHAELRLNEAGPWLIELAGRSIGGLCSSTLRFASEISLEELILRQILGLEYRSFYRENQASGVMMIPIPEAGIFRGVAGCQEAEALPLIEQVEITARPNYSIKPLPEGDSYLGFIFARGPSPEEVESALRQAHQKLQFKITPELTVISF